MLFLFFSQTVQDVFLSLTSKRALMIAETILVKDTGDDRAWRIGRITNTKLHYRTIDIYLGLFQDRETQTIRKATEMLFDKIRHCMIVSFKKLLSSRESNPGWIISVVFNEKLAVAQLDLE